MAGRSNTGQDTALIGQRNAGMSVIRLLPDRPLGFRHEGFDTQIVSTAGANRSLCFIYPTLFAMTGATPRISQLDDVIAVDFDRNELVLFADYAEPAEEYELIQTIPIDTDGISNLEIVDVSSIGGPGSVPNAIFILMTDGQHMGEHRLVMAWEESDGSIQQRTHKFVGGVPAAMQRFKFFPPNPGQLLDSGVDIVIVSSTSEEIVIFEDDSIDITSSLAVTPIFAEPIYVDVGAIPASSSVIRTPNVNGANKTPNGIVLSFSDSRELKVFTYMD